MKRSIFFLITIVIYVIPSFAQAPDTLWTKTYGRPDSDEGLCVQQTFDGGFIITGFTQIKDPSTGLIQQFVYLLKTDEYGDTLWTKYYGSSAHHVGNFVQQTSDSGYIIAGGITHFNNDVNAYLIKTDINGNLLWERSIGGASYDEGNCVRETTDGGYIIAGYTRSYGNNSQIYLIKTDTNGLTEWIKTYGDDDWDEARSIQVTSEGEFIIVGYKVVATSPGGADSEVYLLKTDSDGDTLWTKLYGYRTGFYRDEGWSVQQTTDGGFIIAAETWYPGGSSWLIDAYLIKTAANGDTTWTRAYNIPGNNWSVPRSVWQTLDGGYIIAGYSSIPPLNHEVLLIKINADGDTVWTKNLGKNLGSFPYDEGWSVQQTTDGGYIVTGFSWNYPISDSDVYIIRLAPNPTQIENEVDNQLPQGFALYQNYPNPFNPTTTIKYSIQSVERFAESLTNNNNERIGNSLYNVSIKVYDVLGAVVAILVNEQKPAGSYEINFNADGLPSGVYLYKLQAGSFVETKKMILLK